MMQRRIFDVATMLQSSSSRLLHFKKRESPCRSEQKPDAFVCSARGHASVNKPIRLPCVYVCTLRATYFCRTRWFRCFFRRIFPFRSSNTSLSLPRPLSSRLYPTTRCFLLLLFFLFPDPFILDSLFAVAR